MPLPSVLAHPPWRKTLPSATASSRHVESKPIEAKLVWEQGEREAFRGKPPPKMTEAAEEKLLERLLGELDKKVPLRPTEIGRLGDEKLEELAEELDASTTDASTLKLILGRLGESVLAHAVAIVRSAPRERGLFEAAMPIRSAELAPVAASAFFERPIPASFDEPFTRSAPESWMLRHLDAMAAADPSPRPMRAALAWCAAHGMKGGDPAMTALAPLTQRTDPKSAWALVLAAREDLRAVALLEGEPFAAELVARIKDAQAEKQLAAVPEAVAELPPFFDVAELPKPKLLDGTPLPDDAVRALGEMLRFSPLGNPYLGIAQVRAACDAASLDAFALDLFERWRAAGEDPREAWAFESCGKIGGDRCARAVSERVRAWARNANPEYGDRNFSFARAGCTVLAALDARLLLEDLAKGGVQGWLRREATRALGGEPSDFDDVEAPVPDVGLDPDGSATFDLGKRTLRVVFDESLTPVLADANGDRVASFPRAKKDDDAEKYAAAKARYAAIVKDAKIVARFQLALLERMMCSQRTFTAAQFRERFVEHTFLRHLGRRVVWLANGTLFRVAEDGSFADSGDKTFALGQESVGIAHPVLMKDAEREAWRQRFHDYEIVQPLEQLDREIFVRTTAEIGEHDIARIVNVETVRGRLYALTHRDWRIHDERPDVTEFTCALWCGAQVRLEVTPPLQDGVESHKVTLAHCSYALDRLPPIDFSELMRDLDYLRASST